MPITSLGRRLQSGTRRAKASARWLLTRQEPARRRVRLGYHVGKRLSYKQTRLCNAHKCA
jgi:hypothetical protein